MNDLFYFMSIRNYPDVTASVGRTTEESTTTESERNNGSYPTVASSSNFTEFWQNKSSDSSTPIIEVPRTIPQTFTDKWTSTELTKSSSTEVESSTSAFANNISSSVTTSSSVKPIYDENTTDSDHEQFSTKTESPTTSKSTIIPECHGILCSSSTISPTRNDSDASITFFSFLLRNKFFVTMFTIETLSFSSVTVHVVKIVNLDQV